MKNQIKIASLFLLIIFSINTVSAASKWKKESFKVQGNCGMCKQNIEASLKVTGIDAALWNPDSKLLKVKYDPKVVSIDKIHQLVADAGYDTDVLKASEVAYNKLAKCCQYRSNSCSHDK